jgi:hypothetical protein
MSHRRNLTELNLLQKSQQKSEQEIEDYKKKLISEIKQWKKEDIVKPEKKSLWKKIKTILGL